MGRMKGSAIICVQVKSQRCDLRVITAVIFRAEGGALLMTNANAHARTRAFD